MLHRNTSGEAIGTLFHRYFTANLGIDLPISPQSDHKRMQS
jgi:hypothetical protein